MNSIIIKKLQEDIELLKNQIKLDINIMLESSKNIKVFQEFENNAKEIFEHQRKTEHFYLSKQRRLIKLNRNGKERRKNQHPKV